MGSYKFSHTVERQQDGMGACSGELPCLQSLQTWQLASYGVPFFSPVILNLLWVNKAFLSFLLPSLSVICISFTFWLPLILTIGVFTHCFGIHKVYSQHILSLKCPLMWWMTTGMLLFSKVYGIKTARGEYQNLRQENIIISKYFPSCSVFSIHWLLNFCCMNNLCPTHQHVIPSFKFVGISCGATFSAPWDEKLPQGETLLFPPTWVHIKRAIESSTNQNVKQQMPLGMGALGLVSTVQLLLGAGSLCWWTGGYHQRRLLEAWQGSPLKVHIHWGQGGKVSISHQPVPTSIAEKKAKPGLPHSSLTLLILLSKLPHCYWSASGWQLWSHCWHVTG